MPDPLVSVILSVKNGMPYLPEAVTSILEQKFSAFELLILDNASQDETRTYLQSLSDSRVHIILNEQDLGIAGSRNKGFQFANAPYVAPMDADDFALPQRLGLQFEHMEKFSNIVASGGQITLYENGQRRFFPVSCGNADCACFFDSPIAHPSSILRKKSVLDICNGYKQEFSICLDYGLWADLLMSGPNKIDNISDTILRYRIHPTLDRTHYYATMSEKKKLVLKNLCKWFWGDSFREEYVNLHSKCGYDPNFTSVDEIAACVKYMFSVIKHNATHRIFYEDALMTQVKKNWTMMCESIPFNLIFPSLINLHAITMFCDKIEGKFRQIFYNVMYARVKKMLKNHL